MSKETEFKNRDRYIQLGIAISTLRKMRGLSQEQLAERMCVSRSAIAKWETDKGLPDIENLKILSRFLGVSMDSLLSDSDDAPSSVIRKQYHLSSYGRGCKKVRKDRLMCSEFPDARICTLLGRPVLAEEGNIVDSTLGFLTPIPFGSPEFMKSVRDLERDFYLVEREDEQFFATVTDDTLELRLLPQKQTENTFHLGNWVFVRGNYLVEE